MPRGFSVNKIFSTIEIRNSTHVIRNSFRTVAKEFDLTRKNCPTHPSFITTKQLLNLKKKGLSFFGGYLDEVQIGFIAIEKADMTLYYLEKLAILPDQRHYGYGQRLVEFAINYVQEHGATKISIGTIDEQIILKEWYKKLGFKEVSTKQFSHLPFTVCYMEIDVPRLKI